MIQISAKYLDLPKCAFKDGVERSAADQQYRFLREIGAYDSTSVNTTPIIMFVFPDEFTALANQLYHNLRTGNTRFPGMKVIFGIAISPDLVKRVPKFSVSNVSLKDASMSYAQAIQSYFDDDNPLPDFAIVLCDKTQHGVSPSPYYTAKIALAARGIPSQMVTVDLLQNTKQMEWALANVALQIFVKLGGHPWYVVPSSGAGDIIIGIGRSERFDPTTGKVKRCVGYTTCYDSYGLFKSIELFEPRSGFYEYLDALKASVENAISNVVKDGNSGIRLVFHVPKRFSRAEREQVEDALSSVRSSYGIEYVVLRLDDNHPFKIHDLGHSTFAPRPGLCVTLDSRNRVLILEGRPATGMMRKPVPNPLWVTLQASTIEETDLDSLSQQIYDLAASSWRGFNARARPITTHYSKLIAEMLAAEEDDEIIWKIYKNEQIRGIPWFI